MAAFPAPEQWQGKFWPAVNRIDNVHGDRNLFCSCPPPEDWEQEIRNEIAKKKASITEAFLVYEDNASGAETCPDLVHRIDFQLPDAFSETP